MKKLLLLTCMGIVLGLSLYAGPQGEVLARAPLRVGIMTDADSMPLMLARDEGFFEQEEVNVELIAFSNPQERDAAIQAGRLDGAISDLLAAAFFAAGGLDFKVTSFTDGRYGIVAAPQAGIRALADLKGKRIGLSTNTIIQYTVDAQLAAAGLAITDYEALAVPRMPLRMEMVLGGQIEAASMPEPLLTAAAAQGAVLLSTTDTTGIDAGIMLFSKAVLDSRLADIIAFYRAYYRAALLINVNSDSYRSYLVSQAGFPEAIRDQYRFVSYRRPGLPEAAQIQRVLDWLKMRNLLDANLAPADLTDSRAVDGL
jgi:NitT/TauT family transport system substrate-binding protein